MGAAVLLLLFGQGTSSPVVVTGYGRLEYTMPQQQLAYTVEGERLEFTVDDERLEYSSDR